MDDRKYINIEETTRNYKAKPKIHYIKFSDNLLNIKDKFNVFLFDMRGVLHIGNSISEKKLDLLKTLRQEGKKVIIASNNTSFSDEYIQKVKQKGLEQNVHFDFTITAGDVLKYMVQNGEIEKLININKSVIKIFVLDEIKQNIRNLFFSDNYYKYTKVEDVYNCDVVLAGTPKQDGHRILTTKKMDYILDRSEIFKAVKINNIPILVPNPDTKMPYENGSQTIGSGKFGSLCKKYKIKVIEIGKPSKYFYNYIKMKLKENNIIESNDKIVMIGDSFATDIIGGNQAGFKTIAVVNKKGNMGLTLKRHNKKFIKKIEDENMKPTIIMNDIV